jgi:hypothetical protein
LYNGTKEKVMTMIQRERLQNLIIVAAVDGYATEHNMHPVEAFDLFERYGLFQTLKDNYETLHTQSLGESAAFAADYIARQTA